MTPFDPSAVPPVGRRTPRIGGNGCLIWGLTGCGALIVLALILGAIGFYALGKNPKFAEAVSQAGSGIVSAQGCSRQLAVVRTALGGYRHDHSGHYPARLADLAPKYLPAGSSFRCTDEAAPGGEFVYTPPAPDAPGDAIVVSVQTGEFALAGQHHLLSIRLLADQSIVLDQVQRQVILRKGDPAP